MLTIFHILQERAKLDPVPYDADGPPINLYTIEAQPKRIPDEHEDEHHEEPD